MSFAAELLSHPLWQAQDLGKPIPPQAGEHAVSVCLPTWASVLGYEEAEPAILEALQAGYPRFRLPHSVLELGAKTIPEARLALPFPRAAANRASAQLQAGKHSCQRVAVSRQNPEIQILGVFSAEAEAQLRLLWRYYGEGISARCAQSLLANSPSPATTTREDLRQLLAQSYQVKPSDLFLFPSGMAANAACLRALQQVRGALPSHQFGFPYVDCLRLQKQFTGARFTQAKALQDFEQWLRPKEQNLRPVAESNTSQAAPPTLALFCEAITNPLIEVLDLPRLHQACQQAQVPLVVDDSVPSPALLRSLPHADLLTSSLTKWVSAHANVMGGLLALHAQSPWANSLRPLLTQAEQEVPLAAEDSQVLFEHAQGYSARVQQAASNALEVGHWLQKQPEIKQLWWSHSEQNLPHWQALASNPRIAQETAAPLLSLQLPSEPAAEAFYDALQISKGPSFGTQWSLACPYTLLAHYDELDWCAQQGVPRDLIRLSIGLEEPPELIARLQAALLQCPA